MKQQRTQIYKIRNRIVTKDSEGVPEVYYGAENEVRGEVWPASDRLQAQTYGDRVNNIMNMRFYGKYEIERQDHETVYVFEDFSIRNGDGVCVYSDNADYQIISIKPYKPIRLEIERIL